MAANCDTTAVQYKNEIHYNAQHTNLKAIIFVWWLLYGKKKPTNQLEFSFKFIINLFEGLKENILQL